MAEQRSTLIIEISSEQARRNAQALDRELRSIQNSGNYATTSMNSMSVACRQLAGYMMGIVTVGTAISKMDEFTNLNNRLRLVTDTQKELTLAMKDTFDIAQRSGAAWGGTAAIYQKIQYNSEKLGLSQIQVAKVTESISKSISNSGSSAQAAGAALYQLGQAFDKSSLNGDEFVSMSENAGYLMEVFSKGLGVTRAELKEMSSDGQLTTDKMIQAIQKMSGSIEDDFGKTNFTIGQGFTQVSNAVTKFVGESGQATGAATAISGSLGTLAENLNAVTNIAMIGGAYWLGSYIPAMYASVVAGYAKAKQLVEQTAIQYAVVQAERVAAAQELAGAEAKLVNLQATRAQLVEELKLELARKKKQISDQGAINSELRMGLLRQQQAAINVELTATENALAAARTRSTAAAAASMGVGRGLLGLLTGPVGLGLTVAAVAGSYLMLKDSTKDTTSTLDLQKGTVAELVAEYSKLDDLQKRTTMRELEKQVKDLSTAYTVSFSDLNAFIGWLEDSGSVSESTAKKVNALFKEYRLGGLSASEFATAINGLSGVQDKHKQKIDDLTTAQAKSKTEYEKVKTAQDALTKQTSAAIGANEKETASINAKGLALEKLNQKQQDALNAIKGDIAREAYIIANMKAGFSRDKSEFYADYRSKAELGYVGKSISSEESATVAAGYKLKQQNEARLASEKAIEASQKKQTKEAEKKYQYTQAEAKLLSKAYGDVSKSGLGAYAESRGIPANVIAGLYMQESKAGTDLTSHTGAKGNWQTTSRYREQNNISVADNNDFLKVGKIVVDNIAKVFADTGSLKQAVLSHNAGETGASNFMKDGRVKGSGIRNKEVAGYLPSIDKWASWASGGKGELLGESDSGKDYQEFLDAQLKKQEAVKQLQSQFDTEAIQRSKERDELINQATILGQTHLIPKIKERYNQQELLASYQLELELNGYKWGEDQKIAYRRDIAKLEYDISGKYGAEELKLRKNGIDALAQYEIDEYRKTQQLKIAEYQLAFSQPLTDLQAEVLDMQAKANMGGGYGAWALQNQYGKDLNSLGANYDKNVDNINEDKTITDDAVRKQMLLDAEESFRLSKLKLNEKYTLLEQDLVKSQHQEQLQVWGNLLGQAQNTWSQITQVVKDSNGEQSTSFKIAFAAQQMFAMGSATISALQAYNQILASPWYMDVMSKSTAANMVLGMGMANVGLIGAQALTGMAHNGIDNIPKEGTWLLDGGERVLNPQQNKDLTNYLSNKGSGGGNVEVNVQVTDSGVTSQSNQADQKQLGQLIGNAVRAVIMQEKRQGGLLSK